jgi:hypothetical protein
MLTVAVIVILAGASVGPNQPADASGIGYGIIKAYSFNDIITGQNVNSMTVTSSGSTYSGAINTNIFVVPSQSFQQQNSGGTGTWMVRVAVSHSKLGLSAIPILTSPSDLELSDNFVICSSRHRILQSTPSRINSCKSC